MPKAAHLEEHATAHFPNETLRELTLIVGQSEADATSKEWRGKVGTVICVPDIVLSHPGTWALIGKDKTFVNTGQDDA